MTATVPNKPKTPTSTFRIPVELKQAAQTKAANEQPPRTLTDVVVQGLEDYVKEQQ